MSSGAKTSFLDLDDFTQAYIECMLWSENDESDVAGGKPLEDKYDFDDFTPLLRAAVMNDCSRFQTENAEDLAEAKVAKGFEDLHEGTASDPVLAQAGHDFWLTRCGHGAGFWDGDWPREIGQRLTAYCKGAGERHVYVTDEGKLDAE